LEYYQGVRVEEDAFRVLRELPAVQLGECHTQLGTLEESEVADVARVELGHLDNVVKDLRQRLPEKKSFTLRVNVQL
jgi:hypothetical protein